MIHLKVSPAISLIDEPVKIQAWGLPPEHKITLRAWLKDERGNIFHSRAFYISDLEGKVDLDHSPATGGDFRGVHPMGLFWSLKPFTQFLRLFKRDMMGSPFYVHIELYCHIELNPKPESPPATTKRLERRYASHGVQRLKVKEGQVRGALFMPPGKGPFPGVIDLFGLFGGLIEYRSSLLASHGFATLALAYFAYEDLPKTLERVDLKYFEEAVNLLSNHPKVSRGGIGVVGMSKGAEIALAMSCYLPRIAATVCINGYTVVTNIPLSYGDLLVPGIPYHWERSLFAHSGAASFIHMTGHSCKPEHQVSVLPVEKAKGPILFMVGGDDQSCDSLGFANKSLARAEKYNKKDVYMRYYPGAGHLIEPPGAPFCVSSYFSSMGVPVAWGGELVAHCKAQEMCWREMQDFLHRHIPCPAQSKL